MNNFQIIMLAAIASFPGVAFAQETAEAVPAAMVADGGVYAAVSLAPTVNPAAVPPAPSSTTISSDGTTATDIQKQGSDWQIDGGTLAGSNLFHSFDSFSLAKGDTAVWSFSFGDQKSITNVINRVTGGAPSLIDGTLDSTALPNADFFFINPAGIVMHENAVFDVGTSDSGSAHFSTASELGFSDGTTLSTATPTGSTFSMATPDKLGFFGTEAALSVLSGENTVKINTGGFETGGGVHLSGTDLRVDGLNVDARSFTAIATGSQQATVKLGLQNSTEEFAYSGNLFANLLDLQIKPPEGKTADDAVVVISGGNVAITNSDFRQNGRAQKGSGSLVIIGESVLLSDTRILTVANGTESSGNIIITGQAGVTIKNPGLRTQSRLGRSGDITISARQLTVESGLAAESTPVDVIESPSFRTITTSAVNFNQAGTLVNRGSEAGNIRLQAENITIGEGVAITSEGHTSSAGLSGDGGTITLAASETLQIEGSEDSKTLVSSRIFDPESDSNQGSLAQLPATAGDVILQGRLVQIDGARIESTVLPGATGTAGSVTIEGETIELTNEARVSAANLGANSGDKTGGSVSISGSSIDLRNGSIIRTDSVSGSAGDILLEIEETANIEGGSRLLASAGGANSAAGDIRLNAENITISDGVFITSEGDRGADGGSVTLTARETLQIEGGEGSEGSEGSKTLVSSTIFRSDLNQNSLDDLSATAGEVSLQGRLVQIDGARIESAVAEIANGTSGSVTIEGDRIELTNGAMVIAANFGTGSSGNVTIEGDRIEFAGGAIVSAENLGANSGDKTGGSVSISGSSIDLRNGSIIRTDSVSGSAGDILLEIEETANIEGGSGLLASSGGANSAAGDIRLNAENITISDGAFITSEGDRGADGGSVTLTARETLQIADKETLVSSRIFRSDSDQGNLDDFPAEAGEVSLQGKLVKIDGATVESTVLQSTTGTSGSITIEGEKVELTGGAIVTATNFGPNSGADTGGSVRISGNLLELRNGSEVSTNSINGPAGDIVFEIEDTATISKSTVSSSSPFGGRGGAITISAAQLLVEPGSNLTTSAGGIGSTGVTDDAAAGDIRLQAEIITIGDEVLIASEGDQGADGGSVTLTAREKLQIAGKDTLVSSRIRGSLPATAGQLTLQGRQVQIDGATIASTVAEFANGTSGSITIEGEQVLLNDAASVTAANFGQNGGADTGGSVRISGNFIELRNGSIISTNSSNGPAGDILFSLPDDGLLRLVGGDNGSSVITTSSGPGTGGVIAIAKPLAIISQGGDILALGDAGGANVQIKADFYIDSADTLDRIEVDGDLTFEGDLDFTAMGEEQRDPGLLDAGAILSGRCLAAFASGETSQLSIIRPGPYGLPIGEAAQSDTIDELAMDARAGRICG